jgi:type II secretory pathway pseudopilin PulG
MAEPAGPERVPSAALGGPPPPNKTSLAPCLIIGICVGVGGIVILGILAALLLPAIARATELAKVAACSNNLRQLYSLQITYMSVYGGPKKEMPSETGSAFWLKLSKTTPPLVTEMEIYSCPVLAKPGERSCDYLGPSQSANDLQSPDPVGADRPGNHREGGNVIHKDGSVTEHTGIEFTSITGKLSP